MLTFGLVWFGLVWYGLVWYGMVWYTTIRRGRLNLWEGGKEFKFNSSAFAEDGFSIIGEGECCDPESEELKLL